MTGVDGASAPHLRRTAAGAGVLSVVVVAAALALAPEPATNDPAEGPAGASPTPVAGGVGSGQEFDGCRVVERRVAEDLLRGPVRSAPPPSAGPAVSTCVWETDAPGTVRTLQLSVFRGHDLYTPDAAEDRPGFEALEGIGSDAYYLAGDTPQVHLVAGDHHALLSVSGLADTDDSDRTRAKLVELALRVASALA